MRFKVLKKLQHDGIHVYAETIFVARQVYGAKKRHR